MSDEPLVYFDSSAIVKLIVVERESGALNAFLDRPVRRTSSRLALTEVLRTVAPYGTTSLVLAERELARFDLLPVDDRVLRAAARLDPPTLRTLDAIHIASAMLLQPDLSAIVTYDRRMQEAVRALGLPLSAPA